MTSPLTLLLLSGGGHTGTNVIATLAPRRAGLRLLATSDVADEPALFAFDAVYLAPPLLARPLEFEARVLEIVEREYVDLVIPCRDEDVCWLAGLRARRPELAPRLLCGAAELAEVVRDKWLSYEFCRRHELPFAASVPTGSDEDAAALVARLGLPLVAKPRLGANSQGITVLSTQEQVVAAMGRPGMVLQQFLGDRELVGAQIAAMLREGVPLVHSFMGDKRSIQVMIDPAGEIASIACTRNLMTGRITRSVSRDDDPAAHQIGRRCASVFAQAGWRGPLNIQCQPEPGGALLIHEFNARFTGATAARRLLGIDEVGLALRLFTGHELPAGQEAAAAFPACACESLAARAASPEQVAVLAADGVWRTGSRGTAGGAA